MTERVLGPTGSPRRRWTLLLPLVAVIALGLFYIAGAQAVHELVCSSSTATRSRWQHMYQSADQHHTVKL